MNKTPAERHDDGMSHETLAEMLNDASRITHFMNKFRKMGLLNTRGI